MIIKQRYNLMLNPKTVEKLDKIAKIQEKTRSELVEKILLRYITEFQSDLEGQQKLW